MDGFVSSHWWVHVLRRLPRPLLASLDAWSYRIAMRRAEKRKQALTAR